MTPNIHIGKYIISPVHEDIPLPNIWIIDSESGKGGLFPIEDIENIIGEYYNKNISI